MLQILKKIKSIKALFGNINFKYQISSKSWKVLTTIVFSQAKGYVVYRHTLKVVKPWTQRM